MGTKYQSATSRAPRLRELPEVTATALKTSTAEVLDQVVKGRAIAITKHDRPRAVLVAYEDYLSWKSAEADTFDTLLEEYRGVLDAMQSPEQKAAAVRAFNATPEELAEAAVQGARKAKPAKA